MTFAQAAALGGYVTAMAAGQVMFKVASTRVARADTLIEKALDPVLLAAFALYASLSVAWLALLRGVPLSTIYPFVALSFVATPILGAVVLGERLNLHYALGIALICAGVLVTQRAVHAS